MKEDDRKSEAEHKNNESRIENYPKALCQSGLFPSEWIAEKYKLNNNIIERIFYGPRTIDKHIEESG